MKPNSNRRYFLKLGAGTTGAFMFANPLTRALAATCGLTPPQTPGPFYPGENQFHNDSDLTVIPGHTVRALGQIVHVIGRILNQDCKPIKGATVEIWQACASGKYNNPSDTNTAPLDPHFKYWAESFTNENGEYTFKTIVPGAYPADTNWTRPPHIHFKVSCLGYRELVTQMYFKGHVLNDQDLILQKIPKSEQASVIVEFVPSPGDPTQGALQGAFDIILQSVR